MNTCNT